MINSYGITLIGLKRRIARGIMRLKDTNNFITNNRVEEKNFQQA